MTMLRRWISRAAEHPLPGPFRAGFWRSPLRGPWFTAMLSVALLPGITLMFLTGLASYAAYNPNLAPRQRHHTRQGVARILAARLANRSVLVVLAQPGGARDARPGAHPDRAGQAVVGATQTVRVATGPLDHSPGGPGLTAAARRWRGVRAGHRGDEHPVLLCLAVRILPGALLRSVGVHRRVR